MSETKMAMSREQEVDMFATVVMLRSSLDALLKILLESTDDPEAGMARFIEETKKSIEVKLREMELSDRAIAAKAMALINGMDDQWNGE